MPQVNRQSIGFNDGGIERLKTLCDTLGTTQRELIASFLHIEDAEIAKILEKYRAERINVKKERVNLAAQLKASKELTPEQLQQIAAIIGKAQ